MLCKSYYASTDAIQDLICSSDYNFSIAKNKQYQMVVDFYLNGPLPETIILTIATQTHTESSRVNFSNDLSHYYKGYIFLQSNSLSLFVLSVMQWCFITNVNRNVIIAIHIWNENESGKKTNIKGFAFWVVSTVLRQNVSDSLPLTVWIVWSIHCTFLSFISSFEHNAH